MDERPKCKETTKILEEKTGNNLSALGHSNFLLDMSLEASETKAKVNYWDLIKINKTKQKQKQKKTKKLLPSKGNNQ